MHASTFVEALPEHLCSLIWSLLRLVRLLTQHPRTCRHVLEVHRAATQRREVAEDEAREEAFFKRFLEFCRARVAPRLSEPAADSLVSQYVELREQVTYPATAPGGRSTEDLVCSPFRG